MTDRDIYDELASAFGWPDDMTAEEPDPADPVEPADMYQNADSAAEIESEVLGF